MKVFAATVLIATLQVSLGFTTKPSEDHSAGHSVGILKEHGVIAPGEALSLNYDGVTNPIVFSQYIHGGRPYDTSAYGVTFPANAMEGDFCEPWPQSTSSPHGLYALPKDDPASEQLFVQMVSSTDVVKLRVSDDTFCTLDGSGPCYTLKINDFPGLAEIYKNVEYAILKDGTVALAYATSGGDYGGVVRVYKFEDGFTGMELVSEENVDDITGTEESWVSYLLAPTGDGVALISCLSVGATCTLRRWSVADGVIGSMEGELVVYDSTIFSDSNPLDEYGAFGLVYNELTDRLVFMFEAKTLQGTDKEYENGVEVDLYKDSILVSVIDVSSMTFVKRDQILGLYSASLDEYSKPLCTSEKTGNTLITVEASGPDLGKIHVLDSDGNIINKQVNFYQSEHERGACMAFGDGSFGVFNIDDESEAMSMYIVDEIGNLQPGYVKFNLISPETGYFPGFVPIPGSDYEAYMVYKPYHHPSSLKKWVKFSKGTLDVQFTTENEQGVVELINRGAFAVEATLAVM